MGISPWPVLADYLIDELDKLSLRDYAVLLSLCETGRVVEVLYGRRREAMLKTIVFAAANRRRDIPPGGPQQVRGPGVPRVHEGGVHKGLRRRPPEA